MTKLEFSWQEAGDYDDVGNPLWGYTIFADGRELEPGEVIQYLDRWLDLAEQLEHTIAPLESLRWYKAENTILKEILRDMPAAARRQPTWQNNNSYEAQVDMRERIATAIESISDRFQTKKTA